MLAHSDMLRHTPARRRPLYYFLYYVPRLPPDDILASCEQMKPFDCSEPYLRRVLRFIGITDIDAVRIEGVPIALLVRRRHWWRGQFTIQANPGTNRLKLKTKERQQE